MREKLQQLVQSALTDLITNGQLPPIDAAIKLSPTKDRSHGDFACNIALVLAKQVGQQPRELAAKIVDAFGHNAMLDKVEIAGPGFINFYLAQTSQMDIVREVLEQRELFGRNKDGCDAQGQPIKAQVEFVSANPTGPLHVGHGRGAAVGDSLCRLLETSGWDVTREFYYNDAGQQIDNLTLSVQLRCKGISPESDQWPEDGYRGDYIRELADAYMRGELIAHESNSVVGKADPDDIDALRLFAVTYLRREQDLDLTAFDVRFDVFSLESSLYTEGKVDAAVAQMIKNGHTYEKDGALWLKTTAFGDDKDRVMRKSNGSYTYFVPDVAYHHEKWQRGFTRVINEQGSDHHSTITRVRAGLQALEAGIPTSWPDYVLHQMVTVMKNGAEVKISKRAGSYVTLRDLIDEVGSDATRYFLVARRADSQLTFDIDLALQKNNENPVYYIQYAHARVCSALNNAQSRYNVFDQQVGLSNLQLLTEEAEINVAKIIANYPSKRASAATDLAPHTIAAYLRDLAAALHGWYASGNQDHSKQLLVADEALRNARLCLAAATRQVLANGLALLGVSAPASM